MKNKSVSNLEKFRLSKNPCCFIFENSFQLVSFYSKVLSGMNVRSVVAGDAKTALEKLNGMKSADIRVDFIIGEIDLPGEKDEFEILRKLRKMPEYASTPLIVITKLIHRETVIEVIKEFKPIAYIFKPAKAVDLLEALRKIRPDIKI